MKEYKGSNHKYNVLYALPRIKQHSISCKYYEITDKTIKKV